MSSSLVHGQTGLAQEGGPARARFLGSLSRARLLAARRLAGRLGPGQGLLRRHLATIAIATSLAGCATTAPRPAVLLVEAIRNNEAPPEQFAFALVDGMPPGSDEATFYDMAVKHVRTALSSKGLYEAPPGTRADMRVEIDFGMEAPLVAVGDSFNIGWSGDDPSALRADIIIYDKYLRITARETPEQAGPRPPRELWSIYVTNTDEQTNLPRYLLYMVAAAMDMIAEHSAARRIVVLTTKDERVQFVERGM